MADFERSYHHLKAQGLQVAENLAAIGAEVTAGKQKERELSTERSNLLDEREELKEKLQASDQAKLKAIDKLQLMLTEHISAGNINKKAHKDLYAYFKAYELIGGNKENEENLELPDQEGIPMQDDNDENKGKV